MKAYLEIVELKNDIVTTSSDECCDYGCPTDILQMDGQW